MAVVLLLGACSDSESEPRSAPSPTSTEQPALVFLRGDALVRLDLESGVEERLGRVAAPDVFSIPGSSDRFLLVADKGSGEDFAGEPHLSVIDESGRRAASLGAGFSPLPNHDGDRVAFLRTAGERVCEGEVCGGQVAAFVGDLEGGTDALLPPGEWSLIAWAGDKVVVGSQGRAFLVGLGDELKEIPADPNEVWGASPDGRVLVLVSNSGVEFLDLDSGDRRPTTVDAPLAEGDWDASGSELLAVKVKARGTELVRLSADGDAEKIAKSDGAAGPVLWGRDGSFAYVRADGLKLEAVYCTADGSCRSVLRWNEGVVPLALQ